MKHQQKQQQNHIGNQTSHNLVIGYQKCMFVNSLIELIGLPIYVKS